MPVASSLIAVAYVWRFVEVAYFRAPSEHVAGLREAPAGLLVPAGILLAAVVFFGIDPTLDGRRRGARGRVAARGCAMSAQATILAAVALPLVGALLIAPRAARRTCAKRSRSPRRSRCSPSWRRCTRGRGRRAAGRHAVRDCCRACRSPSPSSRSGCCSRWWRRGCGSSIRCTRSATCAATTSTTRRGSTSASPAPSRRPWAWRFAANALTLFFFYEMLTLVTYPLVTHHGTDGGAGAPAASTWASCSRRRCCSSSSRWSRPGRSPARSISRPGGILRGRLGNAATGGLLALYMFGIGKAALMPFHRWLPAAMVAPTPVSALLHAVAVVKAGVFTVVKVIVYIFGVETIAGLASVDWLPTVAGFTIVAASIVALRADNLKRRLAYSTVSQLSYVVLAAALLDAAVGRRRRAAHRRARLRQDHAVLRRRRDLHRRAQDRGEPARRHRPPHAVDDGRVRHRRAVDDRPAADRGLRQQVVHPFGRRRVRAMAGGRR